MTDLRAPCTWANKPSLTKCHRLRQQEADVPDAARVRMDENLTSFADSLGACERILKTPIPLTYTR